jgi:hypothetical protein
VLLSIPQRIRTVALYLPGPLSSYPSPLFLQVFILNDFNSAILEVHSRRFSSSEFVRFNSIGLDAFPESRLSFLAVKVTLRTPPATIVEHVQPVSLWRNARPEQSQFAHF